MKIITWNVNGIRSLAQKGFAEFLEQQKPDFLCVQETKAHPDQMTDLRLPPGYKGYWSAAQRAGYSGVATFTRHEPSEIHYGIGIPKFDAEGRVVRAKFGNCWLYNIYFPNGGSGSERHDFKQEFLKRLSQHLRRQLTDFPGDGVVVVGDYNVAYLDIDVYDPRALSTQSGFLREERQWFTQFLEQGFIDGFRYFHPDEKQRYTWWAYYQNARAGNRGWRIDHICVSRNLEKKLKSVEILEDQLGSDHCPVVAEIDLS